MPVAFNACLARTLHVWVVILTMAAPASADIILTLGDVAVLSSPPASVEEGALESDFELFAFGERQNVLLPFDLRVNLRLPGLYISRDDLPFPVPVVPAGTVVNSFLLHADPATRGIRYGGAVTFGSDVLGVILGGLLLAESDFLGLPGTSFPLDPSGSGRGLALSGQDALALSPDARMVLFEFRTGQAIDQVRVITAARAIPEPPLALLLGAALAAAFEIRRRRR